MRNLDCMLIKFVYKGDITISTTFLCMDIFVDVFLDDESRANSDFKKQYIALYCH